MSAITESLEANSRAPGNGGAGGADGSTSTPEAKKPYRQILIEEISEGRHQLERSRFGLFMSGLSAGLDIGFSVFLAAVVQTLVSGNLPIPLTHLLVANAYSLGFIFVVLGRSELFTEHTSLAVLPVLSGQSSLRSLARLWVIVYVANIVGTAGFAALMVLVGPAIHVIDPEVLREMAQHKTAFPPYAIFASAVLAAWLMGLLSWLVTAARDTISQIVIVWLIAGVIGLARLHHAIVGSVTMLGGVFTGGASLYDYGYFLLWTTLGNAVGGTLFVAILKYSHASRESAEEGNSP